MSVPFKDYSKTYPRFSPNFFECGHKCNYNDNNNKKFNAFSLLQRMEVLSDLMFKTPLLKEIILEVPQ